MSNPHVNRRSVSEVAREMSLSKPQSNRGCRGRGETKSLRAAGRLANWHGLCGRQSGNPSKTSNGCDRGSQQLRFWCAPHGAESRVSERSP